MPKLSLLEFAGHPVHRKNGRNEHDENSEENITRKQIKQSFRTEQRSNMNEQSKQQSRHCEQKQWIRYLLDQAIHLRVRLQ